MNILSHIDPLTNFIRTVSKRGGSRGISHYHTGSNNRHDSPNSEGEGYSPEDTYEVHFGHRYNYAQFMSALD